MYRRFRSSESARLTIPTCLPPTCISTASSALGCASLPPAPAVLSTYKASELCPQDLSGGPRLTHGRKGSDAWLALSPVLPGHGGARGPPARTFSLRPHPTTLFPTAVAGYAETIRRIEPWPRKALSSSPGPTSRARCRNPRNSLQRLFDPATGTGCRGALVCRRERHDFVRLCL